MDRRRNFEQLQQRPSLGQVFLRQDWPCQRMAELLRAHDVHEVLEIGPGAGILTKALLAAGFTVTAVEKDRRFVALLGDVLSDQKSLELVEADVLAYDFREWARRDGRRKAVCGNIPYNISSPLLTRLLPLLGAEVLYIVFMVQLEFAHRLVSGPNSKDYGSLSVYTQLRSSAHLEFQVSRNCFYPVPKVDSAVVSFEPARRKESMSDLIRAEQLTRQAFCQRRKKLSNSLSLFLKDINRETLPVDLNRRCDSLSPDEFMELSRVLSMPENSR